MWPSQRRPASLSPSPLALAPRAHRPVARHNRTMSRVSLAAALVPLVVGAARALGGGWVPVGEPALVAVRSGDVLGGPGTGGVPLVGPWADTSAQLGFDVHHPGPLLYDVLALPVRLAGNPGLVVAVALLNALAVVGIYATVRRVAGSTVAALAMALVAVLCWVTGTAALVEPGYPGTVLLPFLWFLVLVWAVLCGRVWCLPVAVAVGAFVGGTDLRVALFVPVLLAVAAVTEGRLGAAVRQWGGVRRAAGWPGRWRWPGLAQPGWRSRSAAQAGATSPAWGTAPGSISPRSTWAPAPGPGPGAGAAAVVGPALARGRPGRRARGDAGPPAGPGAGGAARAVGPGDPAAA